MFDVSWTDPTRETVGQRKTRKAQKSAEGLSRATSVASTRSGDSRDSSTQTKPSFLELFGSSKKSNLARVESQPRPSALRVENPTKANRRISSYTASSESSTPAISSYTASTESSTPQYSDTTTIRRIPGTVFSNGESYHSEADQSNASEVSESIFSGRTGRSIKTDSTWSSVDGTSGPKSLIQPLDSTSYVSQSTEVTVSPRESMKTAERVATVVHISAAGTVPIQLHDSSTKKSPQPATFDFPIPNRSHLERIPSPTLGREIDLQSVVRPIEIRPKRNDTWKPPETWECEPADTSPTLPPLPEATTTTRLQPNKSRKRGEKRRKKIPAEFAHLKRSIRRMEAASSKIVLDRLKEEWIEAADASVYRELELEKQLWMLTALRKKIGQCSSQASTQAEDISMVGVTKVLSLFENQASSSTLSVLSRPLTEIHHLSTTPLSPRSYPNIHPLSIPGPTHHLPYASGIFTSIHAFSLPSLLPANSIPLLLKECHRCLTSSTPINPTNPNQPSQPAGKIHLTLLSPTPIPSTLGPKLRTWLDENLLINLETQFRCLNPGRMFPVWLAAAGLRGEGSTVLWVEFLASFSPGATPMLGRDFGGSSVGLEGSGCEEEVEVERLRDSKDRKEEMTKIELKSVVGRMLWREIWGPYVLGRRWWWEDGGIVEECVRLGTRWEYAIIEGVKEG